jgi:hypothetical protein
MNPYIVSYLINTKKEENIIFTSTFKYTIGFFGIIILSIIIIALII